MSRVRENALSSIQKFACDRATWPTHPQLEYFVQEQSNQKLTYVSMKQKHTKVNVVIWQ